MIKTSIARYAMTPPGGVTIVLKHPENGKTAYLSLKGDISKLEAALDAGEVTRLISTLETIRATMPLQEKN